MCIQRILDVSHVSFVLLLMFLSITETLHSNGNLPSLSSARSYCCSDQSCLGEAAPEGLKTVPREMHDWYSKSMQKLQARNPPPRQSDVAMSFPVMHSSSQHFPEMFETKDFEWFFAMPLFLCCAVLSGVGRTFIDPCPKLKAWLRVSPLCKILDCHLRSW